MGAKSTYTQEYSDKWDGATDASLCYFSTFLYAGLYIPEPLTNPLRAGFVAASQIPVVVGAKNNLLGMLTGFGYEQNPIAA
ncbi:hypothetical protein BD309DRAFT_1023657 [Dichomitus squalens]|nr:hypothetical protein BD309DRAFT_1023657 [Dichomitus squalens]